MTSLEERFEVFDSHCHLDADDFDADRNETLARAALAGVSAVLIPATDLASSARIADMVGQPLPPGLPRLFAAVGIHPHSASEGCDGDSRASGVAMGRVRELAATASAVAIGETGLDYHYNFSPPEAQRALLAAHVRLALELDLPLVLHCREAEADLLRILDEEGRGLARGVVHCYTGTLETAVALLERGFYLGFTAVLTFRKSEELRGIARHVPMSRILVETDAPYLAPPPHRGRRNEPAWVGRVAAEVGRLHGIEPSLAAARALDNTIRCFGLPMEPRNSG